MAFARVVTFDGVDSDRIAQVREMIEEGDPPEGLPSSEIVVLHDPDAQTSLTIVFFANEDDYRRGDEILNAMPAPDTPGARTSVSKYEVAARKSM
jgi:hypothetical protein